MHFKKYLSVIMKNISGIWVRLKAVSLLPIFVFCILLPFLNRYDLAHPTHSYAAYNIDERMLFLLPVSVCATVLYLLHPYVEGQGRELLYLYKTHARLEMLIMVFFNIFAMSLSFFMMYRKIHPYGLLAYGRYLLYIFFFSGSCLAGVFITRSVGIGMLPTLLFYVCSLLGRKYIFFWKGIFVWNYSDASYVSQTVIVFLISMFAYKYGMSRLSLFEPCEPEK